MAECGAGPPMKGSSSLTLMLKPTAEGLAATAWAGAGHIRFSRPSYLPPACKHNVDLLSRFSTENLLAQAGDL